MAGGGGIGKRVAIPLTGPRCRTVSFFLLENLLVNHTFAIHWPLCNSDLFIVRIHHSQALHLQARKIEAKCGLLQILHFFRPQSCKCSYFWCSTEIHAFRISLSMLRMAMTRFMWNSIKAVRRWQCPGTRSTRWAIDWSLQLWHIYKMLEGSIQYVWVHLFILLNICFSTYSNFPMLFFRVNPPELTSSIL